MAISKIFPEVPIVLENGPLKLPGLLMRLTPVGVLVELDSIPFKIGAYMMIMIQLNEQTVLTEKVRSVKHYDKFIRKPSSTGTGASESANQSKRLCELHFYLLSDSARVIITKYLIQQQVLSHRK